ncbi:MAG: flagellar hook protein, partial [Lachnospiraceae bacterium]|nr:flagellar hook protein [Lachnospiraceae bacterium]
GTLSKSAEKLSSGYKVNRAADDAAGLAISEKMRKQIRGLSQASLNAEDGISAVQTAEGALTEVHDMLQRMNELAVKAANGTNALSDRQTIQDEVSQLLTEIDRVAETTKFNEMYLLKGDADTVTRKASAKDAGLVGTLREGATAATFTINKLKLGDTVSIGGQEYTIGSDTASVVASFNKLSDDFKGGELVTLDGVQYTVADGTTTVENEDKNILTAQKIEDKIKDGSSFTYNGVTYTAMVDETGADGTKNGHDATNATIITVDQAELMIEQELRLANNIGTDSDAPATVTNNGDRTENNKTYVDYIIEKGDISVKEDLNFSLHVGADADMNNKIGVKIQALDTAGLGIRGLNVKDGSGAAATYAIDAIADAVSTVSAQRSLLGAVQNRLEHTINNLDNVVENTTAAESQIRDTDMATEMVKYSNANILSQAGQSMLAQGNQANQGVLSLLG